MFLRRVTETEGGTVVDYVGHFQDYILLVRIDETKLPEVESSFPMNYGRVIGIPNEGDRRVYGFRQSLTKDQIGTLASRLVELGAQSFEFRDWRNKVSPPTKEVTRRTKHPITDIR